MDLKCILFVRCYETSIVCFSTRKAENMRMGFAGVLNTKPVMCLTAQKPSKKFPTINLKDIFFALLTLITTASPCYVLVVNYY